MLQGTKIGRFTLQTIGNVEAEMLLLKARYPPDLAVQAFSLID